MYVKLHISPWAEYLFASRRSAPGGVACGRLVIALLLVFLAAGCVERRMTIRTNPPGALVYVDDYEVGITPVSTSFLYYGNRKIRIVKDGYETLTVIQPVPAPWYEIPGVDFFSENLVPGKLHDQRTLDFALRPQTVVPTEQLMGRAEELRRGTQANVPGVRGAVAPGVRVNPPQQGPSPFVAPAPAGPEVVPAPVGSQPIYSLPPPGPGR